LFSAFSNCCGGHAQDVNLLAASEDMAKFATQAIALLLIVAGKFAVCSQF
jgi:hypothetical protein